MKYDLIGITSGASALNNNRKAIIEIPILPWRDLNRPNNNDFFCKKLTPFNPRVQQCVGNIGYENSYQKNYC